MKRIAIGFLSLLFAWSSFAASKGTNPYIINHAGSSPDPTPQTSVLLDDDELFEIHIINTDPRCFTYNFGKAPETTETKKKGLRMMSPTTEVVLTHPHVDGVAAYQVVIGPRKDAPRRCPDLPSGTWTIPVVPRWNVAMTGAFSQDGLTSHRWYLEDGKSTVNGTATDGFFVRRQQGASDQVNSSFAAMIHLFRRSNIGALRYWAPISFGLGLKDQNNATFMAGTSFRIGQKFFLTAGVVSGKVDRLPNGIKENAFVTDSNAIATLGTRTRFAPFVAFSYSFLNVPVSFFQGKIPVQPQPTGGGGAAKSEENNNNENGVDMNPKGGPAGTEVTITGKGFTGTRGQVKFGEKTATITNWKDTEIKVKVPAFEFEGDEERADAAVVITAGGKEIAAGDFEVTKQ
jgi:IPT/TIG domain